MADLKFAVFKTDFGWMGILGSAAGLLELTLPQTSSQAARAQLGDKINLATNSPRFYEDLIGRLRGYFKGNREIFPDKLDLLEATDFQCRVWQAARAIPYGETRSYSWVAAKIGKPYAVRAVGQALGKNPLPIVIPCHRVLGNDGKLCGFRGGLQMKQYLLKLED